MDLAFAADTLRPISPTHILARRMTDAEALQNLADENPLELMKVLMESFSNKSTVDVIEKTLVPYVVAEEDWKKWWSATRSLMKKGGNYVIPSRKVDPILFQPNVNSLQQRYLNDFKQCRGFKARLTLLSKALQGLDELDNPKEFVQNILPEVNNEIAAHQDLKPELALEGVFLRDELKRIVGIESEETITPQSLWALHPNGVKIIELLPNNIHKEAIVSFKDAFPETWGHLFLENINNVSAKFCAEIAELLMENNYTEKLGEVLAGLIGQHQANSELLLWLARQKPEAFEDLMNVRTLRAMLAAVERDQFNDVRSNRLRDYILNDKKLVQEMIALADIEEVKDMTRTLQFSPIFEDMDKRSILMRIVKLFPAVQSLISGEQATKQDEGLIVSWGSLERKKEEYADLVHKRIPANTKEIAIARSYGDLRENHEFKAAREMQKLLLKLKAEMESDMDRARGTDFKDVTTEEVAAGTKVTLKEIKSGQTTDYVVLGAWDFDDAKNIISYLSPIAQAMLHKKVGEEVDFGDKKFTVASILPAFSQEA